MVSGRAWSIYGFNTYFCYEFPAAGKRIYRIHIKLGSWIMHMQFRIDYLLGKNKKGVIFNSIKVIVVLSYNITINVNINFVKFFILIFFYCKIARTAR